ncbi:bifunctional diguanylate cyclase/phosphodiesterase [Sulfuriferula nivalis]|uniref:Diguanylate cyclase/phosphodiesterase n=1 Tax=Sulfuriferula nivalis TaxID=2675298 RepID=A0A809RDQ1_9PROT|nr:EAL domain-containing protein [Sulfuriferula nivalis]BBO99898.1 hypothetical protein SFSGTM_06070 [Sulfuriferula nivalis]
MKPTHNGRRFSAYLWLTLAIYIALIIAFAVYVRAEKAIDTANDLRLQSYLLADELRQSSDDLTRMARAYTATGNPIYKQHYQEILDIRNGKHPRPEDYENIYWDLVQLDDQRPRPSSNQTISLLDLMRQAHFTNAEFAKLALAKANSDALTHTEFAAFQRVENDVAQPVSGIHTDALAMLHSQAYYQDKAAIMQPISQFQQMVELRTNASVEAAKQLATQLRWIFIILGAALFFALWRIYRNMRRMLGGSLHEIYQQVENLAQGKFYPFISIPSGMNNSVLGWLAATQTKLNEIDTARNLAQAQMLRMTSLYAALSQCNQAIVRSKNQTELFAKVCEASVTYGGMKMAWIGWLDTATQQIIPVSQYGEGTDYIDHLHIVPNSQDTSAHGPTTIAIRNDQAYYCQDFITDPTTAPWHELGKQYGWGSSATLPIHQNNQVVGAFNMYSSRIHAFDAAAQRLLEEMVADIDFALANFERRTQQQHDQLMTDQRVFMLELITSDKSLDEILTTITHRVESLKPDVMCSILLLDAEKQTLHVASAPSLPDFFNAAIDGEPIGENAGSCGNTAYTKQRTIVEDIAHHPYWKNYRAIAQQAKLAACWSEPIIGSQQKVLGTFALYQHTATAPNRNDIQLIEMLAHFIAIAIERKRDEINIHNLAHFDPLTDLPNRLLLEDRARQSISVAQRAGSNLAVLFLDLDHFKNINDNLGHRIGDELLIQLAQRLKTLLRDEDTVSRLGGDEFIFVLPDTHPDAAAHVAEKLLAATARPYQIQGHELILTASVGIAIYPQNGDDFDTLIKHADVAMYRAKNSGRNSYRYYTEEMQAKSARILILENALRRALDQQQFVLNYQPQISTDTGKLVGAETLLRWHHPELGLISPAEFIPIAEDSGQIYQIGAWVLRTAIQQLKSWIEAGLPPMIIAVNLSAVQFRHTGLPDLVTSLLNEIDLPAQYLELELTESVAMDEPLEAIAIMDNLHNRGVRMSIDDFGTGYSSLNYLKKFKVYKLKIDQSFIRDINTDPEDKAIVTAIISMAHSLGFQTIAEGVETAEQLDFLRIQGCDEIQGYHYSKPLNTEQFSAFVRDWQPLKDK